MAEIFRHHKMAAAWFQEGSNHPSRDEATYNCEHIRTEEASAIYEEDSAAKQKQQPSNRRKSRHSHLRGQRKRDSKRKELHPIS